MNPHELPDLKLGDRGDLLFLATNTLSRLNYLTTPTELFTEEVEIAVKAFQQDRGLIVTGEINAITHRSLEEARWKLGDRILSYQGGAMLRGDDVATLQSRLIEMGFSVGRVDGIYGPVSSEALKEFQKSVGVKVDGSCGPATVMALMRLVKTVSGGASAQLREEVSRIHKGPALANKVILLDPSADLHDREIAFDIAQRLEGRLIALGVAVLLTRSKGNTPTDSDRVALANGANTDLVISIHADNYINENAHGVATYYYGSDAHGVHSVVGERFAALVQREITARTDLLNCRTHAKSWDLLRLTKAPAVRIDCGYLSNPGDAARLADPEFRETLVESIVVAIQRLYLSAESDAATGTLKISDLRQAGIRIN